MKKIVKILSIILLIAIMFNFNMVTTSIANPGTTGSQQGSTQTSTIDDLMSKGEATPTGIENLGGTIINIVTTVAMIISVIVLLVLGIKYMMGSTAEKAEYKKTMIPYLVGGLLIFGASGIAKFVISIAETASQGLT